MTKARQVRPAYSNEHVPRAKTGMVESFEPVLGGFLCSRVSFQLVGCRGWFLEGLRGAPKPTDGLDLPTIPATTPNGRHHRPHVHCRGLEEKRGYKSATGWLHGATVTTDLRQDGDLRDRYHCTCWRSPGGFEGLVSPSQAAL